VAHLRVCLIILKTVSPGGIFVLGIKLCVVFLYRDRKAHFLQLFVMTEP